MPKSVAAKTGEVGLEDCAFEPVRWMTEMEPMALVPKDLLVDLVDAELVKLSNKLFDLPCFHPELRHGSQRERDFQELTQGWYREGRLPAWRGEYFDICSPGSDQAKFRLERIVARHLGFWTEAVHVNGLRADGDAMWLARRSMAKDSDPGMLDNMAAGGLSAGESIEHCLWRECWEEAGVSPEVREHVLAKAGLKPLRRFHIQCIEAANSPWAYFRRERLYAFSLTLPQGFVPTNQDGEVSSYTCVDRKELAHLLAQAALTKDAALVASLWLNDKT